MIMIIIIVDIILTSKRIEQKDPKEKYRGWPRWTILHRLIWLSRQPNRTVREHFIWVRWILIEIQLKWIHFDLIQTSKWRGLISQLSFFFFVNRQCKKTKEFTTIPSKFNINNQQCFHQLHNQKKKAKLFFIFLRKLQQWKSAENKRDIIAVTH